MKIIIDERISLFDLCSVSSWLLPEVYSTESSPNNIVSDCKTIHCVKKIPYWKLFWSAFFPDFTAFGLNTERYGVFGVILVRILPGFSHIRTEYGEIFSPNAGKSGKNAYQNNSEYGLFYAVIPIIKVEITGVLL